MYPILSRLKREGLLSANVVESSEGPPRKYYRLTTQGRRVLAAMNAHWRELTSGIAALMRETP